MRRWDVLGADEPPGREPPDLVIQGRTYQVETAPELHLARNMAAWGAPVHPLPPWDWEQCEARLEARWGRTSLHPSWWVWDAAAQAVAAENRACGEAWWTKYQARCAAEEAAAARAEAAAAAAKHEATREARRQRAAHQRAKRDQRRQEERARACGPPLAAAGTATPWEVLGVAAGASPEACKVAYRAKLLQYHPDRVAHLGPEFQALAHDKTLQIQAAFARLTRQAGGPGGASRHG